MIDDRRYETCVICGERWNVATVQRVPDDGYVCPKCRMREKQTRFLKGGYHEQRLSLL